MELENLEADCESISDIISVDEVVALNHLITDPETFENPGSWENGEELTRAELGGPEFEIDREEDYHEMGESRCCRDIG